MPASDGCRRFTEMSTEELQHLLDLNHLGGFGLTTRDHLVKILKRASGCAHRRYKNGGLTIHPFDIESCTGPTCKTAHMRNMSRTNRAGAAKKSRKEESSSEDEDFSGSGSSSESGSSESGSESGSSEDDESLGKRGAKRVRNGTGPACAKPMPNKFKSPKVLGNSISATLGADGKKPRVSSTTPKFTVEQVSRLLGGKGVTPGSEVPTKLKDFMAPVAGNAAEKEAYITDFDNLYDEVIEARLDKKLFNVVSDNVMAEIGFFLDRQDASMRFIMAMELWLVSDFSLSMCAFGQYIARNTLKSKGTISFNKAEIVTNMANIITDSNEEQDTGAMAFVSAMAEGPVALSKEQKKTKEYLKKRSLFWKAESIRPLLVKEQKSVAAAATTATKADAPAAK